MNSISSLPLSPGSKLVLYADDIVLYQPTNSTQDTDSLQHDIQLIVDWIKNHGLTLNSSKTNILPIIPSPNPIPVNLLLGNQPIQMVGSFRYLSVTILSDLSWTQHIRNTTKAVKQQSCTLHRKLNQATPPARLTILYRKVLSCPSLIIVRQFRTPTGNHSLKSRKTLRNLL